MDGMNHTDKSKEWEGMPLGLGMRLSQQPEAAERFWHLSESERAQVVSYVQGGSTGEEAQERIAMAIYRLMN